MSLHSSQPQFRDTIKAYIETKCLEWLNNWSLSENELSVEVMCNNSTLYDDFKVLASDNLYLLYSDKNFSWDESIFGDSLLNIPASTNLAGLLSSAKKDFLDNLCPQQQWQPAALYTPPKHWRSYFEININLGKNQQIRILIPLHCATKIFAVKPNQHHKVALTPRAGVVNPKICPLSIKLDFGEFSLAELSQLKIGSVLTSELSLSNKFLLETNQLKISDVAIGKIADRKVFMISGEKK